MNAPMGLFHGVGADWQGRLAFVVDTMREMSGQTSAVEMGRAYRARMRKVWPLDASISLSRRDLKAPRFRITRSTQWKDEPDPWTQPERLPLLSGGLLAELIYGDEPRLIDDIQLAADDPAAPFLEGFRSMAAIPLYDRGQALNMVLLLRQQVQGFDPEDFPQMVWMSNLFGRATQTLVLSEQVRAAYEEVDYEMKVVADIQRALLPERMPVIPTMGLAAHYQTSHRAGGDYYDFFPLPEGKWGLLIADVSGHGTPAAVLMAVLHSLVHHFPGPPTPPGALLDYANARLIERYTRRSDMFVTAFYGVYDPARRALTYASAGHNPPRLKRCEDGTLALLTGVRGLPLGIMPGESYREATHQLVPGDQLVLYTDGITEAYNASGQMFGLERLDRVLENCSVGASDLLRSVLVAVEEFTGGAAPHDDRTVLVAKIS